MPSHPLFVYIYNIAYLCIMIETTTSKKTRIAVIGAGAAGCFAAIHIKRIIPDIDVTVFESGKKPLAKVAITGGGRCNLTNSFNEIKSLATVYPRGERLMKRLLKEFGHKDAYQWFETEGVRLMTQDDECVFPVSQDAMEIVNTLMRRMTQTGVKIKTGHRVRYIEKNTYNNDKRTFTLSFTDSDISPYTADIVLIATGGCSGADNVALLKSLTPDIVEPVPSLFSLCLTDGNIKELMGTVVENTTVWLTGSSHKATGALLITHWGMSGPAILKLSSYEARTLHDNGYKGMIHINWLGGMNEADTMYMLNETALKNPKKQMVNVYPDTLNSRLWQHLLDKSNIKHELRWSETGRKALNRLASTLTNDIYTTDGKNRFKEEFVTCGGVSLSNINPRTMECRTCPGLFFAGETLDIDAITGGFNLQAAWTTGYVAATGITGSIK